MIVPSLSIIVLVHNIYLLGQPNLLLLALLLGAFACLQLGRPVAAGALVATAAAIKAFPILALGYLIYRRMWAASAATVAVLAAWLLDRPASVPNPCPGGRRPGRLVPGHALHLRLAWDRPAPVSIVQLQEPVDHGAGAPLASRRAGRRRSGPVATGERRSMPAGDRPKGIAADRPFNRSSHLPEAAC